MRHACERKLRCAGVGAGGWSGATYACVTAERRACLIVPIIGAMRREERHGTQGLTWQPLPAALNGLPPEARERLGDADAHRLARVQLHWDVCHHPPATPRTLAPTRRRKSSARVTMPFRLWWS